MSGLENAAFTIDIGSFGFKYGAESGELVFDARFLPNPYYIEDLKPLSGMDKACADYVFGFPAAQKTLLLLKELVLTQAEGFGGHGRTSLKVRIGCTGGRHRSVALAEALAKEAGAAGYSVSITHRDASRYPSEP